MSSQPVVMALEPVGLQRAAERRYTLSPNTTRNSPMGRAVLVTRPSLPASCQDRPHSQFHTLCSRVSRGRALAVVESPP